jgi:sulfite exporter TauE/SafE
MLLEKALLGLDGVQKVRASAKESRIIVEGQDLNESLIIDVINSLGYKVGTSNIPLISLGKRDKKEWVWTIIAIAVLVLLFKILRLEGFFAAKGMIGSSLGTVFLLGITAGLSTCMALVGGLVVGISANYSKNHPNLTVSSKIKNQVLFNVGRVATYFVLGGVAGIAGSVFKVSGLGSGIAVMVAGLLMLAVGLKQIDLFPRISATVTLPKSFSKLLGLDDPKNHPRSAALLGALTFFLPCGFTQAMQVYAVSTGSFLQGSLIMGIFALGTMPGIIGVGSIASAVKDGAAARVFFKTVGLLVIILGLYNVGTGFNLSGIRNMSFGKQVSVQGKTIVKGTEAQVFKAIYNSIDYNQTIKPNTFKAKLGKPVRIEIYAESDGVGCMGSVMVPGYMDQPQFFIKGQTTVLEFTPRSVGDIKMTCAMGIQSGIINVTN